MEITHDTNTQRNPSQSHISQVEKLLFFTTDGEQLTTQTRSASKTVLKPYYSDKSAADRTFLLKVDFLKLSPYCLDIKGKSAPSVSLKTRPCDWGVVSFNHRRLKEV